MSRKVLLFQMANNTISACRGHQADTFETPLDNQDGRVTGVRDGGGAITDRFSGVIVIR